MDPSRHPDHDTEQAYVLQARAALDQAVRHVDTLFRAARTDKHNPDAQALSANLAIRRAQLRDAGRQAPCFARLDDEDNEVLYIGRQHIADPDQNPLVIDWRTRAAEPFYRATALEPMGVERRRQFVLEADDLVDIYDTDLTDPAAGSGVPDPLLAEINRSRTGSMREIVATIQAEQDRVVRAPLATTLVVQGGPGTGKTAVGLHRAAYLLFEHREELRRDGVLVVGPNRRFLEYISDVLPSLGERSSRQVVPSDLGDLDLPPASHLDPEIRRLAGDIGMAKLVDAYVRGLPIPPSSDVRVRTTLGNMTVSSESAAAHMAAVLAEVDRVGPARELWMTRMIGDLRTLSRGLHRGGTMATASEFAAAVRKSKEFKAFVKEHWPPLNAKAVVRAVWRDAVNDERALAAAGISATQAEILQRRPKRDSLCEIDRPLIDEANYQLGQRFVQYGHVILDEAQDLSPMALRMVARRALNQSFTILGDVAQCSGDWHYDGWEVPLAALTTSAANVEMAELTVGYRVPGDFIDLANALLPSIAPNLAPTTSVRPASHPPVNHVVAADALEPAIVDIAATLGTRWASVAIIDSNHQRRLRTAGQVGAEIDVLAPVEAKGLEFDAVLVVEAAEMHDVYGGGWRPLFVALTRAVQQLHFVGRGDLPAEIAAELEVQAGGVDAILE